MIHLFIDTNIFLSFYRFSKDQLHRLEELLKLIQNRKVKLYLTQQVIDEFNRNREKVFHESIKLIIDFSPKFPVPEMCREMSESKSIVKLLESIQLKKKKLIDRLNRQFRYSSLKIDKAMGKIMTYSKPLEISDIIYNRGIKRFNLGNPPGKNKSYGDAINWEILLENVQKKQPLYFIGNDGDYLSPIDKTQFSFFLKNEWKSKKGSSVILFNSILEFLKKKNPTSKVTPKEIEQEKKHSMQSLYFDPSIFASNINIPNYQLMNPDGTSASNYFLASNLENILKSFPVSALTDNFLKVKLSDEAPISDEKKTE